MYGRLKIFVILCALIVISGFLIYSNFMMQKIEERINIFTRIYGRFCREPLNETSIIFDEIIKKIDFPVIVTDAKGNIISYRNVEKPDSAMLKKLAKINKPVKLVYGGKVLSYIYYGEPRSLKIMRFAEYLQLAIAIVLLFVGFIWFRTLKRTEEDHIYSGILREAAHQLGTPLSSLYAWLTQIQDEKIRKEIEKDLDKIAKVAERFNKLSTKLRLKEENLKNILSEIIDYMRKRSPGNVKFLLKCDDVKARVDKELLKWGLENILKNSLDAKADVIKIDCIEHDGKVEITVEDNGIGIKDGKRIFSPGFSTKEHGWGLGLTLTKRIVEYHHGKIILEKSKPAKFKIVIPR